MKRAELEKALKSRATVKTQAELERAITALGALQRERDKFVDRADNAIAQIRLNLKSEIAAHEERIAFLAGEISDYVRAYKLELFPQFPERKICKLNTGTLRFRRMPPRVISDPTVSFFERLLEKRGWMSPFRDLAEKLSTSFLRVRVELNKEAILADPISAKNTIGVDLSDERERLYITPAEINADADHTSKKGRK